MAEPLRRATVEQLVTLALQDNEPDKERAYDELYRRYQEEVAANAARMLDQWKMADDLGLLDSVVSRTFTNAFSKLETYDPQRSFRAWLLAICKNAALNRLKQEKKRSA